MEQLKTFVASYYNSLSFCLVELEGRSFGGGALELMPSEIADVIILYTKTAESLFDEIEYTFVSKKNIDNLLEQTNKILLKDTFGFASKDIKLLTHIHKKLLEKRVKRKMNQYNSII